VKKILKITTVVLFVAAILSLGLTFFYYGRIMHLTGSVPQGCGLGFNQTDAIYECGSNIEIFSLQEQNSFHTWFSILSVLSSVLLFATFISFSFVSFKFLGNQTLSEKLFRPLSNNSTSGFVPGLSGLRGIAAIGVGLLHAYTYFPPVVSDFNEFLHWSTDFLYAKHVFASDEVREKLQSEKIFQTTNL